MRKIGDRSERQSDLIVNRVAHHLRNGVPEEGILPEMIGSDVTEAEIPLLIRISRQRTDRAGREYERATRRGALGWIALGVALLGLAYYLSQGDTPLLREGRLALGWIMGGGSLAYGLWRFADPTYRSS